MLRILLPFVLFVTTALAICECGYTVNRTDAEQYAVFTDLLEADFMHIDEVAWADAQSLGWIPQTYNQSTKEAGSYGMAKMAGNIMANPLPSIWDWGGTGVHRPDPGLELWVKNQLLDGEGDEQLVPTAELVSARDDIFYGSFRIALKTTEVNGTCGAFFFYRNDSQEIDVEILSAQQNFLEHSWPVNLVVQNTTEPLALNASEPSSDNMQYYMAYPPYGPPVTKYHEYRFDWLPDRIDYYVDGWLMATFTENIPSSAGAIHLSHWSNGNEHWSQGPPDQDAVMTVAYVKAYFNTTARRTEATENECASLDWTGQNDVMCQIPDQTAPPWPGGPFGNDTGKTSFFTRRMDETVDEPADGPPLRSPAVGRSERLRAAIVLLLTVFWTWMFLEV